MIWIQTANAFEFVVVASLRVRQLVDGCTPRVEGGGKKTILAQREVLARKVMKMDARVSSATATEVAEEAVATQTVDQA